MVIKLSFHKLVFLLFDFHKFASVGGAPVLEFLFTYLFSFLNAGAYIKHRVSI